MFHDMSVDYSATLYILSKLLPFAFIFQYCCAVTTSWKNALGVLGSPGKVLEFFGIKRVGTLLKDCRPWPWGLGLGFGVQALVLGSSPWFWGPGLGLGLVTCGFVNQQSRSTKGNSGH